MAEPLILAFMQNQWVRDPDQLKRILARHDAAFRRQMIARLLFMGCVSGKRLKTAFGDLTNRIVWEEASPVITGQSNGCPPADLAHMTATLEELKPGIVLAFGRIATSGLLQCLSRLNGRHDFSVMTGPHPAARHPEVSEELAAIAKDLRKRLPAPPHQQESQPIAAHVVKQEESR